MATNCDPIGLVVGAGGPTGGPFIDAALAVIEDRTGWNPATASEIVGTSAGAFVAARIKPVDNPPRPVELEAGVAKLRALSNIDKFAASPKTKFGRSLRLIGGRAFALLAPPDRERALYEVASGPYHRGASAVTIEHTWGARRQHDLADNADQVEQIVRASAAIPYKNGPIKVGGVLHADGAVHSANNVDLLDPDQCPTIVVVSPMVPSSGGKVASRFHRAQLFEELRPWMSDGRAAVVIMPTEQEHARRRDRDAFERAGREAATRLFG